MSNKYKYFVNGRVISILLLLTVLVTITSCASQPEPNAYDPPGFFMGIIHGFTILFGFIGSIFFDIRMYAFPNSGIFYDLGYLVGLGVWAGLLSA